MTNMASQAAPNTLPLPFPSLSYCRNTLRAKLHFWGEGRGAGAKLLVYYANAASLWLRTSLCVPHIWVLSELSGITTNRAQKILHEFAWAAHKAKQVTSWRADWWTDCANKQKMHSKKRKRERGGESTQQHSCTVSWVNNCNLSIQHFLILCALRTELNFLLRYSCFPIHWQINQSKFSSFFLHTCHTHNAKERQRKGER